MSKDWPNKAYATERGRFLARDTDLTRNQADAVAYAEQGVAWPAIREYTEFSDSVIQDYMEQAMARYGLDIALTLDPDELQPPATTPTYDSVGPEYLDDLDRKQAIKWLELVDRHSNRLPAEWVADILDTARERGYPVDEL